MLSKRSAEKALNQRVNLSSKPVILENFLFPKQLEFVKDQSSFKVADTSRRAGKSTGISGDLAKTASETPDCTVLYITGTRTDAKKIIWGELLKFNRTHSLNGSPNISELTLSFPNGSIVRLAGAKDEQEVEKLRGQMPPVKKAFIDEAQSIRDSVLTKLLDDILDASLIDFAGSIVITGTPGPVKAGYFYRISHNLDKDYKPLTDPVWSVHHWTFFDNPHIALKSKTTHQKLLERTLKRRGVTVNDPSIQREFFGKWEADTDSLLIHYDEKRNNFDTLPTKTAQGGLIEWNYILGIDIGYNDADAVAVLAWSQQSPYTYLVEESVVKKQDITDLMNMVQDFRNRYDVSKLVIDAGALGKKITEELIKRHQIPLEAADKTRKMEGIALFNDALRTGLFKAKPASKFAQDSTLVEIDRDKCTPDKIVVSKRYHSDIIDAVLYAFKVSPAYSYEPPKEKPKQGTPQWIREEEERLFQKSIDEIEANKESEQDDWRNQFI